MPRATRSHPLPVSTQAKIGRWKEQHPTATYHEVAEKFNCSYAQARSAHKEYRIGNLTRTKPKLGKRKRIDPKTVESMSDSDLIQSMVRSILEDTLATDLGPAEKSQIVDRCVSVLKTEQAMSLQRHLNRVKADIVQSMYREIRPNAEDDEIIAAYKRAEERVKK